MIEAHLLIEHHGIELAFNQRKLVFIHAFHDVFVNITKRVLFSKP
jgi:hypothetical protein